MRNQKRIITHLFAGIFAGLMTAGTLAGNIPGSIPNEVYAAELDSIDSDMQAYAATGSEFTDVIPGKYYYRPVQWAVENGITTGTSPTTFSPEESCTRAQTVTFLWRMAGEPEPQNIETGFTDVIPGKYYVKAVAWALENGITTGRNAEFFDPEGICTRGEFVTFLYRTAGKPEIVNENTKFTDLEPGRFYEKAVAWAVENGVTTGTSPTTFSPYDTCIRGQVVAFLHRWCTVMNVQECGATPNDDTDDTDAFNRALERAYAEEEIETVYVPAGTYVINAETGINIKSNTSLFMDSEAVLDVSGNDRDSYCVVNIRNVQNASITGGQIKGERYEHTGTNGEWGMGIGIYDSSNIILSKMTISSNWGDGIYMGTGNYTDDAYGCDNIVIDQCSISDNRRSNISIVDADNVTINGCLIADAKGAEPQCGINIEPNRDDSGRIPEDAICKNITITNTTINVLGKDDYYGQFFCFMTAAYPDNSIITARDVKIDSCTFNGDCGNYSGQNMTISNTVIRGTFYDEQNTRLDNVNYENIWRG